MKKNWATHVWQALGALALALPLAAALTAHQPVQADDSNDASASTTQHVVLTKFGFKDSQTSAEHSTTQTPDQAKADWAGDATPLAGVKFSVYDVTGQYWADPDNFTPKLNDSDLVTKTPLKTDEQGQIALDLNVQSGDHTAVYLFHEAAGRTGYADSKTPDFWLSLPAEKAADGNVYVYPKNEKIATHFHKFIKKDGQTNQVLKGAEFSIQDSAGNQLLVTDEDGEAQTELTGYIDAEAQNYKLSWATTGTTFVTDSAGAFGISGLEDATTTFKAVETKAPAGYEKADATDFAFDDKESDILDQPTGLLPHTGGAGIIGLLAIGAVLIVLTVVGIRKRQARA
ncbi:pilin N-terminal domain-containing protein [Lacticaseibacillus parakribbianus]|uniref:pilin N-terminal domain-containing protein n=1 Tax=Lacticaseibacillus parakribbianus TaxID=2970927 RepID=UPI0021CAF4A5|nr:pilin N-terminal domain-containing protein [Lacticaseibacillus parakribbianus]